MNISIFDVCGPVMIGPSSSHTAGAAKLAKTAALIAAKPFNKVCFQLHGSFAKTGDGHGTKEALLAGAMGFDADDERIAKAFEIAKSKDLQYSFSEIELAECHENTAKITFYHTDETIAQITGSSIGGGRILITRLEDMPVEITAESPTIIISQHDKPGVVSEISRILAENKINIAVMRVSRVAKGDIANTVIETDNHIPQNAVSALCKAANVLWVKVIDVTGGGNNV